MKITKKSIEKAVRENNVTMLFKMFKGNRSSIYEAITTLPIKKLSKRAYSLAYGSQNKYNKHYLPYNEIHSRQVMAIMFAKAQVKGGSINSNYGKVMIEGNNNIYWAHPSYGHNDYNKSIAFENNENNRILAAKINSYLKKHI